MKIDKVLEDPYNSYIYMERCVNNGSPSGFRSKTIIDGAMNSETETFNLLILEFDKSVCVKEIGNKTVYKLDSQCILCHPDNLEFDILKDSKHLWKIVGELEVSPTASGRTVRCYGNNTFFVKLDYKGILGRISRNLNCDKLQSAKEVTQIIKNGIDKNKYNPKFALLPEDYGKVAYIPYGDSYYELGFLLRNDVCYTKDGAKKLNYLIPAFSMFGKDAKNLGDDPLVVQLYEKQNKSINDFAYEDVFKPVIDSYFDTLLNGGLCLEAHAQNMLFAIDDNYKICNVIARDLESVDKDLSLREYLGLDNGEILAKNYKCLRKEDYNYSIMHSFMFDFKLGRYLLDPLICTFFTYSNSFNVDGTIEKIRDLVHQYMKMLPADYFPAQWYNYANVIHEPGKCRPYIAHTDLRYR